MIPNDKLLEYFYEYTEDTKSSKVISYPGFYKFLALTKKFTPTMMYQLKNTFIDYPETHYFIKKVCEGYLVDESIKGLLNSSMSQFVLKYKHGYIDNAEAPKDDKNHEITITFK